MEGKGTEYAFVSIANHLIIIIVAFVRFKTVNYKNLFGKWNKRSNP